MTRSGCGATGPRKDDDSSVSSTPTIVWLRQDLRLADNPALHAAAQRSGPVVVVYVLAGGEEGGWPPGGASRWWLHHSLARLDASLRRRHTSLVLRRGSSTGELLDLARQVGAGAIHWNRRYEPAAVRRDESTAEALRRAGLEVATHSGSLLVEPWDVSTRAGDPYRVFTPFWRTCREQLAVAAPLPVPPFRRWHLPAELSLPLAELDLLPSPDWAAGLRDAWVPGEKGAEHQLGRFLGAAGELDHLAEGAENADSGSGGSGDQPPGHPGRGVPAEAYGERRDLPAEAGTARLSPHLHFGEIGPRQIWRAVIGAGLEETAEPWVRQLGWREFAHHLIYHFPETAREPLRPEFAAFPWRDDESGLRAWQRGHTGYPFVDAGMRELWHTGWMHNRVRMVAASFLVKDLLVPWQEGARWFWDTLADADLANNTLGWQWTAGCGADAAPYFRIFNPVSQGEKFDAGGDYVRRWLPELAALPDRWVQRPWEAPAGVLADAGVKLGRTYPRPIVDHREARERALSAFQELKRT